MPKIDIFGDFAELPDDFNDFYKEVRKERKNRQIANSASRRTATSNEIGELPPITEEILELRKKYKEDYVIAHREIFTASTGMKDFGDDQQEAIRRFQKVLQGMSGGKLVQAEPRGFAKTSRAVNQILLALLQGDIKFALIVSSEIGKSIDIMEQLQTELLGNEMLTKLYPGPMLAFQHADGKAHKAKYQTLDGEPTNLGWSTELIRFPIIPGEVSSGGLILVRTKDNLRGLSKKIRGGPDNGKVVRPDFVLFDDIQTDKDAASPTVSKKICDNIKRSALFGGSHSRKIRAIMTITPNKRGDVASHFILREPSWEVATYSMVKKMPTNIDLWDQFGRIILNFDKYKEGDRDKAQRRGRDFVLQNFEALHEGAEVSWEWAYEWAIDDPVEVSALHHAMVFLYEEGEEAFNYECQCKVDRDIDDTELIVAEPETIVSKLSPQKRFRLPVEVQHIVTHVDMNHELLTYVTMASNRIFRPFIIDYGTYPPQPTNQWRKKNIVNPLHKLYPTVPEGDIGTLFYQAVKDFSSIIAKTKYVREDGVEMYNRFIGFDAQYQTDDVIRGIRESTSAANCLAVQGLFFDAKKTPINEMRLGGSNKDLHFHCYTSPSSDRTVMVVRVDINHMKTLIHRGFNLPPGNVGSFRLYDPVEGEDHTLYSLHCNAEKPRIDFNLEQERSVVIWSQIEGRDNEYFDNTVGGCALLFKLGCTLTEVKVMGSMNMQDYINSQRSLSD